ESSQFSVSPRNEEHARNGANGSGKPDVLSRRGNRRRPCRLACRRTYSNHSPAGKSVIDKLIVGRAAPHDSTPGLIGHFDPPDLFAAIVRIESEYIAIFCSGDQASPPV